MRPEFWIGILAVVGSILGVALGQVFEGIDLFTPAIGTVVGAAAGTAVYAAKQNPPHRDRSRR